MNFIEILGIVILCIISYYLGSKNRDVIEQQSSSYQKISDFSHDEERATPLIETVKKSGDAANKAEAEIKELKQKKDQLQQDYNDLKQKFVKLQAQLAYQELQKAPQTSSQQSQSHPTQQAPQAQQHQKDQEFDNLINDTDSNLRNQQQQSGDTDEREGGTKPEELINKAQSVVEIASSLIDGLRQNREQFGRLVQLLDNKKLEEVRSKKQLNLLIRLSQKIKVAGPSSAVVDAILRGQIEDNTILDKTLAFVEEKLLENQKLGVEEVRGYIQNFGLYDREIKNYQVGCAEFLKKYLDVNYSEDLEQKLFLAQLFEKFEKETPITGTLLRESERMKIFSKEWNQVRLERKMDGGVQIWEKIGRLRGRSLEAEQNEGTTYEAHIQRTGGQLRFRFPPEPNGYLHLGHAKSILANFESARQLGGLCFVRFDDTNPLTESQEYVDSILENVGWMGYTPDAVTYCSDYFEELYCFAERLIEQGQAYVCFQSEDDMRRFRQGKIASPDRDKRSKQENLRLFRRMREGQFQEREVSLRAKIDPNNSNPTLRDPSLYRVRHAHHFRTGNTWCIYPLYDYAHGICDSLQDISYSLCSLEFEIRRDLYYWFLDKLQLYKPIVWEFSRLNVSNNLMSKRKLLQLVQQGFVDGWNDPRLLTLSGLRERGVRPQAIRQFIQAQSIARTASDSLTDINVLNHAIREDLTEISQRVIGIIEPVILELINLQERTWEKAEEHGVKSTDTIVIDRDDIDASGERQNYYGIQLGKEVCLRHFCVVKVLAIELDQRGTPSMVRGEIVQRDDNYRKKLQSQLNWLSVQSARRATLITLDVLFTQQEVTGEIAPQINPLSRVKHQNSLVKDRQYELNSYYQLERVGYFQLKSEDPLTFIQTVKLSDFKKQKGKLK